MRCYICCCWYNGQHDSACPRDLNDAAIKERFDRGWLDGRRGKPEADSTDPVYMFGWIKGDIACDEWWNS